VDLDLNLGVDAENEELGWVQAELPHVDDLLTLELDRLIVDGSERDIGLQTLGYPVEGEISPDVVAGPAGEGLDLAQLANDPTIFSDLEPILELAIHESVSGLEEVGVELDMRRQADLQPPLHRNGLYVPLEAVGLDVNRVEARASFRRELRPRGIYLVSR